MPTYRPVRTTPTAVPDALAALRSDMSGLASVSAGQINGTTARLASMVKRLDAQVRATPAVYVLHGERTNFGAGNVITVSMTVPAGKTRLQCMASQSGFVAGSGVASEQPAFAISIASSRSRNLPTLPANMDHFFLLGSYSTAVDVSEGAKVSVSLDCTGGSLPSPSENWAMLDAFLAFTN